MKKSIIMITALCLSFIIGALLIFRNNIDSPITPVLDTNSLKKFIKVERITPPDSADPDLPRIQREIEEADSLERFKNSE